MLTAASMMTRELVTISPDASIQEAIDLVLHKQISGLPVVDHEGRLIGVITEFALLAIVYDHDVAASLRIAAHDPRGDHRRRKRPDQSHCRLVHCPPRASLAGDGKRPTRRPDRPSRCAQSDSITASPNCL